MKKMKEKEKGPEKEVEYFEPDKVKTKIKDDESQEEVEVTIQEIREHPEKYLEVNIIKSNRMIDTIFKYSNKDKIKIENDKTDYKIDSDCIFLVPKKGYFIPTIYYIEGHDKPLKFENKNRGITCNALSLLWNYLLYKPLLEIGKDNWNLIYIIMLIIALAFSGVALYLQFNPTVI
jgi:hypothetical protein